MKQTLLLLAVLLFSHASIAKIKVGDTPFDVIGKSSTGEEINISNYKGKVVILSFWATWCPPCMKELPVLSGIQKAAGLEKVQVIAVNYRESKKMYRDLVKAFGDIDMLMAHEVKGRLGKKFGVGGIPHMVIIGGDGKVAAVHIGYSEAKLPSLVEEINQYIREAQMARTN